MSEIVKLIIQNKQGPKRVSITKIFDEVMDVYFVGCPEGPTSAFISVKRSWDGSLSAETNLKSFAGPQRRVHNKIYKSFTWYKEPMIKHLGGYETTFAIGCVDGMRTHSEL